MHSTELTNRNQIQESIILTFDNLNLLEEIRINNLLRDEFRITKVTYSDDGKIFDKTFKLK